MRERDTNTANAGCVFLPFDRVAAAPGPRQFGKELVPVRDRVRCERLQAFGKHGFELRVAPLREQCLAKCRCVGGKMVTDPRDDTEFVGGVPGREVDDGSALKARKVNRLARLHRQPVEAGTGQGDHLISVDVGHADQQCPQSDAVEGF